MSWRCSFFQWQRRFAPSLKCMWDNDPPCSPGLSPWRLSHIGGNLLSTPATQHPTFCFLWWLIMNTLRQEANLLRVKVSVRQAQGSCSSNRVLQPVLSGVESLCWSPWCCGMQTLPELTGVNYLSPDCLRALLFFSKAQAPNLLRDG